MERTGRRVINIDLRNTPNETKIQSQDENGADLLVETETVLSFLYIYLTRRKYTPKNIKQIFTAVVDRGMQRGSKALKED